MALIVEDGRGADMANTYADLDCADSYCVPRGLWPATGICADTDAGAEEADAAMIAAKETALVRACDYLNTLAWKGKRHDWEQALAWPRANVAMPGDPERTIPDDYVPRNVVYAQLEIAALIYNGADMFRPLARGGKIRSESHSFKEGNLDVIGGDATSESVVYADVAPIETFYPVIKGLVGELLLAVPGEKTDRAIVEAGRG